MISIHSNGCWINPFVPRRFKIRDVSEFTDTSRGTIAALSLDRTLPDSFDLVHDVCQRYRHVIVYMCEPWGQVGHDDLLTRVHEEIPNVMIFTDIVMDHEYPKHQHVANWFCEHENIYTLPWGQELLDQLRQYCVTKQYRFDALLGVQRPHRDLIYQAWFRSDHRDQILLTYFQQDPRTGIWDVPYEVQSQGPDPAEHSRLHYTLSSKVASAKSVETFMIVPVTVYNNSWYSIIAEGFTDHRGTRLTEKTAKALVSERLFVLFGAPHDLARMQRLGFQTFADIVDESYDDIMDDEERWHAAWRQVEWLCQQDPVEIQQASHGIRAHNRRVFLETDWYANLKMHLGHAVDRFS